MVSKLDSLRFKTYCACMPEKKGLPMTLGVITVVVGLIISLLGAASIIKTFVEICK